MKGGRIIVESLLKEKVNTLFCYPGGAVIPLFDELYKHGKNMRLIQPKHEQGATHAADGYARATGKIGVVIVTSGPGATNTVTGIATAYMDSIPMLVITGQVATSKIGTDAFQEVDIKGITLPITKANFLVRDVKDLAATLKKAFYLAQTGRPGPVLVDIPVDVQTSEAEFHYSKKHDQRRDDYSENKEKIKAAAELLKQSKKPLLICGGGVNLSDANVLVNRFMDRFGVPAVTTLMGHGINPKKENLYYGGIGMHGSIYANYAVQNADLIFALGVRFSDRILGDPTHFAPRAKIVQVDIDPAEMEKNTRVDISVVGEVSSFLQKFLSSVEITNDYSAWIQELEGEKRENPLTYNNGNNLKPQRLIQLVGKYFPEETIIVSDVGQSQMWVAMFHRFKHGRSFLSSGGLGTMGYALPAAIGAKIGSPAKEVLMVAGDGGFQMNVQELASITRYNLNLKMLVLDNSHLGMVRQWQEIMCEKRYAGTVMDDNPRFADISSAMGVKAVMLNTPKDAESTIKALAESKESMLVHAIVDPAENVLPMVPPGSSLTGSITKI